MPKVTVPGRPDWLVALIWLTSLPAALYCAHEKQGSLGVAIVTASGVICATASARDMRESLKKSLDRSQKGKKALEDGKDADASE